MTPDTARRTTAKRRTTKPARAIATTPTIAEAPVSVVEAPVSVVSRPSAPIPERIPPPLRAAAVPGHLTLQPASRLWLEGTSNVKDFSCKAGALDATVATSKADAARDVVAGEKSVTSVELRIPVSSLDCANGTMNGHLRDALEWKEHPTIEFTLGSYTLARSTDGAEGALHLTGLYELDMTDYGVKPPSLMLGTMKVRDKVKVRFDLLLRD